MVLMRLISLYMLTAFCLGFIVNYVPGLMLPIYILAMIGLILCLGHIALHYIRRIRYMLLHEKR
ncbi:MULTISPECIES: hypothetical protein [Bacillus]|uniref:hypothetical protein n=1 Tax=Bacillus TaxID=1386 RepID=UPI000761E0F4|nr:MULTISPECIES: hypothetical protein [Bacillus]AOC56059.1 hypothetical protein BEN31_04380 [Bacillus pumilus]AZV53062.1 hypothetical protein DKE43_08010 [Bacillus pumilus]MBR0585405.1 hypothetical protein [Bacillus pumilus DW2J2]MBR0616512.1 hypothetical protein [Bacillus pumilus]MBR0619814.1 hypothetical protein [Bacillus pumilus]